MPAASHPDEGYAWQDDPSGSAADNDVSSAVTLRASELVQRRGELAAVELAVERAEFGRGGLVLLFGVAGTGRSSLMAAGVEAARARGFTVLCARGSMLERDYAFGVARQLLGGAIAGLPQATRRSLFEGAAAGAREPLGFTSGPKTSHAEYAQIEALHSVVERLAAEMPLMVAVDDLQWCDRLTLDFLCYLGHRATELPIVIVGAWRPGEPRARAGRLQALAGDRDTLFLTLRALDTSGVTELLERECPGGADREVVDACFQRTGGLPLLIVELIRAASTPTADLLRHMRSVVPETVRRYVIAFLASQPSRSRVLAEAIAVLGAEVPLGRASEVADLARGEAQIAADALVRCGLLSHSAGLSYVAPLLRDAVYGAISPLARAELHAAAARILAAAGEELSAAGHLLHAEPEGAAEVAELLRAAGQRALKGGDLFAAGRYLRRALAELDGDVSGGAALAQLGYVELELGRPHDALEALMAATMLATDPVERAARSMLAADAADVARGLPEALSVLEAAQRDGTEVVGELARALQAKADILQLCRDAEGCRVGARGCDADADRSAVRALDTSGMSCAELSVVASMAVLDVRDSASSIAERCGAALAGYSPLDDAQGLAPFYLMCRSALLSGAPDDVDAAVERLRSLSEARSAGVECVCAALSLQRAVSRGDLPLADSCRAGAVRAVAARLATALWFRIRRETLVASAVIHLELDRIDEAWDALRQCCGEEEPSACGDVTVFSLWLMLLVTEGRGAEALTALAEAARSRPVGLSVCGLAWQPWGARAYAQAGESDLAVSLADEHLDRMRDWGALPAHAGALLTRAMVDRDADHARALMGDAIELLGRCESPLERARIRVELGSLLRRAGQRKAARAQLTLGADQAHHCGAIAVAARARSELLMIGARPRRGAFSGVDALTAGERRVAELAADGLTNRQIANTLTVSIKTVSSQLTAVYRKLDIHSRAALAVALCADGCDDIPPDEARF
ncbi:MAG: AAA family ATPase [Solirubrobacterales bacterium]|nr:AAA family ATPase [Solirubrobacterales bacterium]